MGPSVKFVSAIKDAIFSKKKWGSNFFPESEGEMAKDYTFSLFFGTLPLKGGYRKFFFSFIGPVGHNIWWENRQNGSFGPKNCPK